jgi:chaperonin GroEL (HSP60 family)
LEDKYGHIRAAIEFCNLVRSTLGPRGMNKMVISGNETILSNDGATIVTTIKGGNPIVELMKSLAKSQEEAIGDGTTTSILLAGQLLSNALTLLEKGLHPTLIINGYNLAKMECLRGLDQLHFSADKEKIIKTCFGTKITRDISNKLTELLLSVNDIDNLKVFKKNNSNPLDSEIFHGCVFEGFTINDRMESDIDGKIAVLDFPVNMKFDRFNVTTADELEKATNYDTDYKQKIVDKLVELDVKCVFYTDTTPEFETYLTDKNISGIVVFARENVDGICNSTGAVAVSSLEQLNEAHIGQGKMKYKKEPRGMIYVNGDMETLILKGNTNQILEEMMRAIQDAVSLLKHDLECVVGAGAIELELVKGLREYSKQVGGKEKLAIDKFIESLESIPIILAENCGLDAIEILTLLESLHQKNPDMGVDPVMGVSDAREREVFEPVLIKINAINSATNIANLILKLDGIYQG